MIELNIGQSLLTKKIIARLMSQCEVESKGARNYNVI